MNRITGDIKKVIFLPKRQDSCKDRDFKLSGMTSFLTEVILVFVMKFVVICNALDK